MASQRVTVQLAELTWPEVAERISQGWCSALVPLGATEQHGYHLPLSTDSDIAQAAAEIAADKIQRCFVTPAVSVGCSDHHMGFPGSLSISGDTMVSILHDICRSLGHHGITRIYLTSAHAGNVPAMRRALGHVQKAHLSCHVDGLVDWTRYRKPLYEIANRLGLTPRDAGSHGGHYETSVMLYIRENLVRMERAKAGLIEEPEIAGRRLREQGMAAISRVGVIGDPTSATRSAGEEYLAALADNIVTGFQAAFPDEQASVAK